MTSRRSSKPAAPLAFPKARQYRGEDGEPAEFAELPFVEKLGRGQLLNWVTPPCDDYALTCKVGEAYGAHFAQFLKSNYESGAAVGSLSRVVRSIDFDAPSPLHGYWVGFLGYIEQLVFAEAARLNLLLDINRLGKEFVRVGAFSRACAKTEGAP